MKDHPSAKAVRPEKELLLCCARKEPSAVAIERMRALARAPLDWQAVATSAWDHRITPPVTRNLERICAENVPAVWMQYLRNGAQQNLRRSLALSAELLRILDALEAAGIQGIPYKGPTLAALAYRNLALREFGDLDLLMAQEEIERAQSVMRELGYEMHDFAPARWRSREAVPGQYSYSRQEGNFLAELHTEQTLRYFPDGLPVEKLRQRLQLVAVGGRLVPTLGMADLLNFLCVHGAKHFWSRIQWIADVAELVDGGAVDLSRVLERANELGSRRMLLLGLRLTHELLNAEIPEEVLQECHATPALDSMVTQVREVIFADQPILPGILQRMKFRAQMRESWSEGLRYGLRLATAPTEEDWLRTRLPRGLTPLYSLLRPFQLIERYGMGLRPRATADLAPFVPTPGAVADGMLELAEVTDKDVVYDLGCGNGEILVAAAKRRGARCVGIEIDPTRITKARAAMRDAGVEPRVMLIQGDVRDVDLSPATVVTMYLTIPGNAKLRQQLCSQLRAGTRVVSRDWDMPGWRAERVMDMEATPGMPTVLFLWRIGWESTEEAELADCGAAKTLG
jgi:SAM-dependent methyltransferase